MKVAGKASGASPVDPIASFPFAVLAALWWMVVGAPEPSPPLDDENESGR
jgi:hypothetical protein